MTKCGTERRAIVLGVLALATGAACKPATEAEKYRRALRWSDVDKVRAFLDGGMDATKAFPDGAYPVHVVAGSMHGRGGVVRLLVERGADVNVTDGDGKTAWDIEWGDGKRKLSDTDAGLLLALLDAGFEPPAPKLPKGRTLLHAVARRVPSARLVSVLVEDHGLAVDAGDEDGWTPLHVAVYENNNEAATGLLAAGANPNAKTTGTVGRSTDRAGTVVWSWRYEAGSHPLDVRRSGSRSRFDKDVSKVLEQYGATKNPAVDNKSR